MRLIFSRKGFDSASGGCPSPIINGIPLSLPIPSGPGEPYRYNTLSHPVLGSLGPIVAQHTNGRIPGHHWAHADPVLPWQYGPAALGQNGAAASHLHNQQVGVGDTFLFFGLFTDATGPHHRLFGWMEVTAVHLLGPNPAGFQHYGLSAPHPHTDRSNQSAQNTLYLGVGAAATSAHPALRLSLGTQPSLWRVPPWLRHAGLSYHGRADRWTDTTLQLVNRGQEFVTDITAFSEAYAWLNTIKTRMSAPPSPSIGAPTPSAF